MSTSGSESLRKINISSKPVELAVLLTVEDLSETALIGLKRRATRAPAGRC